MCYRTLNSLVEVALKGSAIRDLHPVLGKLLCKSN